MANIYFSFRTNLNAMFLSREIVLGGTLFTKTVWVELVFLHLKHIVC